jgi:hypothetical protein
MSREEFKEKLEFYDYSYSEEGGKILVIGGETKANRNNWLSNCVRIPSGVVFSNKGIVHLESLIGKPFHHWEGTIEGVGSKRLLNKMISIGLFDR